MHKIGAGIQSAKKWLPVAGGSQKMANGLLLISVEFIDHSPLVVLLPHLK